MEFIQTLTLLTPTERERRGASPGFAGVGSPIQAGPTLFSVCLNLIFPVRVLPLNSPVKRGMSLLINIFHLEALNYPLCSPIPLLSALHLAKMHCWWHLFLASFSYIWKLLSLLSCHLSRVVWAEETHAVSPVCSTYTISPVCPDLLFQYPLERSASESLNWFAWLQLWIGKRSCESSCELMDQKEERYHILLG